MSKKKTLPPPAEAGAVSIQQHPKNPDGGTGSGIVEACCNIVDKAAPVVGVAGIFNPIFAAGSAVAEFSSGMVRSVSARLRGDKAEAEKSLFETAGSLVWSSTIKVVAYFTNPLVYAAHALGLSKKTDPAKMIAHEMEKTADHLQHTHHGAAACPLEYAPGLDKHGRRLVNRANEVVGFRGQNNPGTCGRGNSARHGSEEWRITAFQEEALALRREGIVFV